MANAETNHTSRSMRRTWRARLTRATLCLLLGMATTVGVAWGFMHRSLDEFLMGSANHEHGEMFAEGRGQSIVLIYVVQTGRAHAMVSLSRSTWRHQEAAISEFEGTPARWIEWSRRTLEQLPLADLRMAAMLKEAGIPWAVLPASPGPNERTDATTMASGWPFPALRYVHVARASWREGAKRPRPTGVELGELHVPWCEAPYPLLPYWRGFFIDMALYAASWWLLLVTPGAIRRWRRRRRGGCAACGYDQRGLTVDNGVRTCPECGAVARCEAPA